MSHKSVGPLVCLITCFFIVNNCQGQIAPSLPFPLLSNLSPIIQSLIDFLDSLLSPPKTDDSRVEYPLNIRKNDRGLIKSSPPQLEIHLTMNQRIISSEYNSSQPRIYLNIGRSTYLTGGLLNDGLENKFYLYGIFIKWKLEYPIINPYTVGDKKNPSGQVEYYFENDYFSPSTAIRCFDYVRIIFYIAIVEGASETGLNNFLQKIKDARTGGSGTSKIAEYVEPFENTIFKKAYYLYNNATFGKGAGSCSTVMVFPENIQVSKSDFDKYFGTDNTSSQNKYTPTTNNRKKVYYVEPGTTTGGLKIIRQ